MPFTDPLADGPTIQESNDISLANGTNIPKALELLRQARASGLVVPVILMGYYNPLLIYGEERVVAAAKDAGANGFIVVDLPPEEAVSFRNCCSKAGFGPNFYYLDLAYLLQTKLCPISRSGHVNESSPIPGIHRGFVHICGITYGSYWIFVIGQTVSFTS